jgi:hypothetical protein
MGDVQTFVLGDADPPPHFKPSAVRSEYVNHAKGKKQVLWERGLWVDGTIDKIPEDDLHRDQALSMTHVLLAVQGLPQRGHRAPGDDAERPLRARRQGHQVLLGAHEEALPQEQPLRHGQVQRAHPHIDVARGPPPHDGAQVCAHTYKRVYADEAVRELIDIERTVKQYKLHRTAGDFAGAFIDNS